MNSIKYNSVGKSFDYQTNDKNERPNSNLVPSPRIDFFKGKQNPYKNKLKVKNLKSFK